MADYVLTCGTTADLSLQQYQENDIHYISYNYEVDGQMHLDFDGTMDIQQFYQKIQEGSETKTAQINADRYEDFFEPFLKEGKDILHIEFSSGLTGGINSCNLAINNLLERYPDRQIYVVDSLSASGGYGLLMQKAAVMKKHGFEIDELRQWVEENKQNVHHIFFSTDLSHYIKGGRISATAGAIGQALGICPLMDMDKEGHLIIIDKIRTKKKTINAAIERMASNCNGKEDYKDECFINHAADLEDAIILKERIEERFPNLKDKIVINYIGPTIGSHTGTGTVALFYWGDKRED